MANYLIIGSDGKEYGPITEADLRHWLAEGRVDQQTKVQIVGTPEWKLLSELPTLATAVQNPTPPPVPISAMPATAKTSALAITSLVLGILGLFTCGLTALFGLIIGIIALVKVSNSQGTLRGRGLALAGTILSAVFLIMIPIFAAMLLPALASAKGRAMEINCMNNEKQLSLAVKMYSADHTNHFPAAATWCDDLKPFAGSETVYRCAAANSGGRSGYAFNAKLDGLDESQVNSQTVVIFESDAGWNASGGPELLTASVRHGRRNQPACNVAFADGHVETVPVARLKSLRWDP